MDSNFKLKNHSYLIFGLGLTGVSVLNYLKKNRASNYFVWDDKSKKARSFKSKRTYNLNKTLQLVDFVVLSPGISLLKSKHRRVLSKFKKKIITDIDLLYLDNKKLKTIVVTGTNGKSTTCKIIYHLLKRCGYRCALGGNIGTPVLNLRLKENTVLIIEASSFQLSHSKFVKPNYALLLNITNDHLDWHGSMRNYINSKFKIFALQEKRSFALVNNNFKKFFKNKKYKSKLINIYKKDYEKIQNKLNNDYLKSQPNKENMCYVYTLAKLLKISNKSFLNSMELFEGLPHRYEIFLKKKNVTFINDSKATSFTATKYALLSNKNIFWILGGIEKHRDKINLHNIHQNITKAYLIGKNTEYFKKQLRNKIKFVVTKNLTKTVNQVFKDIRDVKNKCTILFSPAAASFDQFKNFEMRGFKFKKLVNFYAKKYT